MPLVLHPYWLGAREMRYPASLRLRVFLLWPQQLSSVIPLPCSFSPVPRSCDPVQFSTFGKGRRHEAVTSALDRSFEGLRFIAPVSMLDLSYTSRHDHGRALMLCNTRTRTCDARANRRLGTGAPPSPIERWPQHHTFSYWPSVLQPTSPTQPQRLDASVCSMAVTMYPRRSRRTMSQTRHHCSLLALSLAASNPPSVYPRRAAGATNSHPRPPAPTRWYLCHAPVAAL